MKYLIKTKCGATLISDCDETCEQTGFFPPLVYDDMIAFGNVGVHKDNILYYVPYEEPTIKTKLEINVDDEVKKNIKYSFNDISEKMSKIKINSDEVIKW